MSDQLNPGTAVAEPAGQRSRLTLDKIAIFAQSRLPGFSLCMAIALSTIYMLLWLNRGWLPQDDGTLAQSALRVLNGQLPHVDFLENYSGGLSYLNAAGFRLFGTNLMALRAVMLLFFLAWLPAVFYVASRVAPPLAAAGITLLCVAWSVPNYPTPMPSWYNLFFAVFGAAALLRFLETGTRRWLFLAGIAGGASIAIKVIGLYYVAAVLLFFLYREQELSQENRSKRTRAPYVYRGFTVAGLVVFLVALEFLIGNRFANGDVIHFLLPSGALATFLIIRALRLPGPDSAQRFHTLFRMIVPFVLGLLVPLIVWLVPSIRFSSVGALWRGVFVQGARSATALATVPPLPAQYLVWPALLLLLIASALFWNRMSGFVPSLATAVALATVLFLAGNRLYVLRWVFFTGRCLTPLLVLLGVLVLHVRPAFTDGLSSLRRQQLMLLLGIVAVCTLVQFPFAAPIYFCYCAPLVILALLALLSVRRKSANPFILTSLLVFYIFFGVLRLAPRRLYQHWLYDNAPLPALQTFTTPRAAGLRVEFADMYEQVTGIVPAACESWPARRVP